MELIANIFGYVLDFWYNICQNYGISIILFALTIKLVMFPLTLKQQKSMKKTQEIQPKLLALQEKYKDNQEAMVIEYQKLLSENKYNPFGGCILSLIQIPILLGLFYVVARPLTYMQKFDQTQIDYYIKEIVISENYSGDNEILENIEVSDEDTTLVNATNLSDEEIQEKIDEYKKIHRYYELNIIKDKDLLNLEFLGINLGDVASEDKSNLKLLIIPLFTVIFYYISLYVVTNATKTKQKPMKDADGNEIPMPNMMVMNLMMPLMSGYISYIVPQGMGLYWFTNSIFQIIIQLSMKKFLDKGNETKLIEGKKE